VTLCVGSLASSSAKYSIRRCRRPSSARAHRVLLRHADERGGAGGQLTTPNLDLRPGAPSARPPAPMTAGKTSGTVRSSCCSSSFDGIGAAPSCRRRRSGGDRRPPRRRAPRCHMTNPRLTKHDLATDVVRFRNAEQVDRAAGLLGVPPRPSGIILFMTRSSRHARPFLISRSPMCATASPEPIGCVIPGLDVAEGPPR